MNLLLPFAVIVFNLHIFFQANGAVFNDTYLVRYGNDRLSFLNQGKQIQLSLNQSNGAGILSKVGYGSGFFQMKIKIPEQPSPGVVTAFYLTTIDNNDTQGHAELDFEFLGSDGPPYILQTNVFGGDKGGREQRLNLWFDPSATFHDYAILWNHHQIVFLVDNIPIRVHKNYEKMGGRYPKEKMYCDGSLWNGEKWASRGRKVDWSKGPFKALFEGFNIYGCEFGNDCSNSSKYWWNDRKYWKLNPKQQAQYEYVRRNFVIYDYCIADQTHVYKECQLS